MVEENSLTKQRFLDLECVPEFQIREAEDAIVAAKAQNAKKILDDLLNDPQVKGEIRKKILKCAKFLDSED